MPRSADANSKSTRKAEGGLYRHRLRPEWGMAVLAWEENGRRGYQFDDGKLRVFRQGYYSLFDPVAEQGFAANALEDELLRVAGTTSAQPKGPTLKAMYPFAVQLRIFRKLYPEGFAGHAWRKERRGLEGHSRLKRHRDAAIAEARALLGPERITQMCEEERYDDVIQAVVDVLGNTNIVSKAALDRIATMAEDAVGPVARALRDLIAGEKRYGTRFTRFVAALHAATGKRPSWRLATALPALVHPEKHVCVRKTVFLNQAATIEPDRRYANGPRRKAYKSFAEMARRTRDRLLDEGLNPRDLMDVYDFIWLTLRPAAAKHID